jgi:hypothetical protein
VEHVDDRVVVPEAEIISPLASAGLLGTTTFIPGRCAKVPHRHWECCSASL